MPTPRHQIIRNLIPTSLFLSGPQLISFKQFDVNMFLYSFLCIHKTNKQHFVAVQRCRDGVMSDLMSWCGHLLVSFIFQEVTLIHTFPFISHKLFCIVTILLCFVLS